MEEWLTLKQAADTLGLKSIKQVRRRLRAEKWRTRLNNEKGFMAVREVWAEDVDNSKRNSSEELHGPKDIIDVPGRVPGDTQAMSQMVKDFLGTVNSIKDNFDKMIESQHRMADTQDRMAQVEEKRFGVIEKNLKVGEKRLGIEERRFKVEKIKNIIWLVLFMLIVGLLVVGVYYGYKRVSKYYENELTLREKEVNVLDSVYAGILEQHEKALDEKNSEIKSLKEKIRLQEEALVEVPVEKE